MFYCSAVNNGLTDHRIKYKRLLLKLCHTTISYEPVYHLYKKAYEVYKKSIASAAEKLMEHPLVFIETKECLFQTLGRSSQQLIDSYLALRN